MSKKPDTAVVPNEYNGNQMFTIVKTDFEGNPVPFTKPLANMGINKSKTILAHVEEHREYVEANS